MRRRCLAALVVCLIWIAASAATAVQAQYTGGLPPGILNVEVDGQTIDSLAVPVTNRTSPEISGRVDLGISTVDLAIANGDIVRFQAQLDERGRFSTAIPQSLTDGQYALYISDLLIGVFAISGALPEERAPGQLLDIARVVPYPTDFADQIPGIGLLDGRFYTIDEEALRSAAATGDVSVSTTREAQRKLAEAGWLQRYESRLAAPDPNDPSRFSIQVSSFVVEYASGSDARTAFAALAGDSPGVEFPTIGNQSVLTVLTGTTPDTGVEYHAGRLVYRVGSMLGMVVYADLTGQEPDFALFAAVAQTTAGRGVVVADRQTVPLGSMALRLDPASATGRVARRDLYDVRAATLTFLYNEDEATRASRIELYSGMTDAFSSTTSGVFAERGATRGANRTEADSTSERAQQPAKATSTSVISIEGEPAGQTPVPPTEERAAGTPEPEQPATAQVFFNSALYAFPGEAEADAWLATQRERLLANPELDGTLLAEEPVGPSLGDATFTFAAVRALTDGSGSLNGYRIYTRTGAIVAAVEMVSAPAVPLRTATNVMEQQLACIQALGCDSPISVPGSLFADRGETGARGADEEAALATPDLGAPSSQSVIIVEGEGAAPEATRAPREDRESRPERERRRDRDTEEQGAGQDPAG